MWKHKDRYFYILLSMEWEWARTKIGFLSVVGILRLLDISEHSVGRRRLISNFFKQKSPRDFFFFPQFFHDEIFPDATQRPKEISEFERSECSEFRAYTYIVYLPTSFLLQSLALHILLMYITLIKHVIVQLCIL